MLWCAMEHKRKRIMRARTCNACRRACRRLLAASCAWRCARLGRCSGRLNLRELQLLRGGVDPQRLRSGSGGRFLLAHVRGRGKQHGVLARGRTRRSCSNREVRLPSRPAGSSCPAGCACRPCCDWLSGCSRRNRRCAAFSAWTLASSCSDVTRCRLCALLLLLLLQLLPLLVLRGDVRDDGLLVLEYLLHVILHVCGDHGVLVPAQYVHGLPRRLELGVLPLHLEHVGPGGQRHRRRERVLIRRVAMVQQPRHLPQQWLARQSSSGRCGCLAPPTRTCPTLALLRLISLRQSGADAACFSARKCGWVCCPRLQLSALARLQCACPSVRLRGGRRCSCSRARPSSHCGGDDTVYSGWFHCCVAAPAATGWITLLQRVLIPLCCAGAQEELGSKAARSTMLPAPRRALSARASLSFLPPVQTARCAHAYAWSRPVASEHAHSCRCSC